MERKRINEHLRQFYDTVDEFAALTAKMAQDKRLSGEQRAAVQGYAARARDAQRRIGVMRFVPVTGEEPRELTMEALLAAKQKVEVMLESLAQYNPEEIAKRQLEDMK